MKRVAVIGGGIAGLAAAWELHKGGARVIVLESRPRLGGVIETKRSQGWLLESGPDSFLTTKPAALDLVRELGLEDQVIPSQIRRVYIYTQGTLHPLPEGMHLTIPTRAWPVLKSGLFSWRGKFRLLSERWRRGAPPEEDESLGSFVRRRFGREAFERVAEPIMAGIHLAPGDRLSLKSTFPRFAEMERQRGSLTRAMRDAPPSGPVSPFSSLRGGIGSLVERLVERMKGVEFRTGATVRRLERGGRLILDDGAIDAAAVVVAIPTPAAADLVASLDSRLTGALRAIEYVGSAVVSLGWPAGAVPRALDGTGFVIPRAEAGAVMACTWSSSKFEGRAPAGRALLRCFIPPEGLGASDGDLVAQARKLLRTAVGVTAEPEIAEVTRWPGANPVYAVGHEERVREIESRRAAIPNLFLTGAGYRGLGLPDCIADGRATGRAVLQSTSP
jgi:oxygen-dependent protoporphyrinogen oxidase